MQLPKTKLFLVSLSLAALVLASKHLLPPSPHVAEASVLGAQSPIVQAVDTLPTPTSTPVPVVAAKPPAAATIVQKTVKVTSTPTGFLNVRSQPSLVSSIIGTVHPGETYAYTSVESGWYRIQLASGQYGWIYGQYVTSINE